MTPSLEALTERASSQFERYRFHFAGHPRFNRDVDLLHAIVAELVAIQSEAEPLGEPARELLGTVGEHLERYRREVDDILEAQARGGAEASVARLATWSDFAMGRYRRNFAGRSRATRDPLLLEEIVGDLGQIDRSLGDLEAAAPSATSMRERIQRSVGTYARELDAIRGARREGTPAERASRLAGLANHQFALYGYHFAAQPRMSRSPALLDRLVRALRELLGAMREVDLQGLQTDAHRKNIELVTRRVAEWTVELEHVREARASADAPTRISELARAANGRFKEYDEHFAGKPRATCDADLLDRILESLLHLASDMDALDAEVDDDHNSKNLRTVEDRIRIHMREWEAIREAQGASEAR